MKTVLFNSIFLLGVFSFQPYQKQNSNVEIIQACLNKMMNDENTTITEYPSGYKDCKFYALKNEFIKADSKLYFGKEKICVFEKGTLFQLGIISFLHVINIEVRGKKATALISNSFSNNPLLEYHLVLTKGNWIVN